MENQKNYQNQGIVKRKEWYRDKIVEMVNHIDNEKFLNQIHTILKKYIEKRGV